MLLCAVRAAMKNGNITSHIDNFHDKLFDMDVFDRLMSKNNL
jgi:hypothetical protein